MILEFYNSFRKQIEEFNLEKNDDGWDVIFVRDTKCDKQGNQTIFDYFDKEGVKYPATLGMSLEHLWNQIEDSKFGNEEAQAFLSKLGDELKDMNGF